MVDVLDGLAVADVQLEALLQVPQSLWPPVERRNGRGRHQGEQAEEQLRVSKNVLKSVH